MAGVVATASLMEERREQNADREQCGGKKEWFFALKGDNNRRDRYPSWKPTGRFFFRPPFFPRNFHHSALQFGRGIVQDHRVKITVYVFYFRRIVRLENNHSFLFFHRNQVVAQILDKVTRIEKRFNDYDPSESVDEKTKRFSFSPRHYHRKIHHGRFPSIHPSIHAIGITALKAPCVRIDRDIRPITWWGFAYKFEIDRRYESAKEEKKGRGEKRREKGKEKAIARGRERESTTTTTTTTVPARW